ncbi:MAG TPA: class I SAM-dependent methyltransferase [Candidatus Dormibacteraeota bacterium]|nr:class I SAM-dependent methyltransferase [Candidatus Dormibacteraeota bacterium]
MALSLIMRATRAAFQYVPMRGTTLVQTKAFVRSVLEHIEAYPISSGNKVTHLPERLLSDIFPGIDGQTAQLGHRFEQWALPYGEAYVLAVVAAYLRPRTVFEFGTFTGASTLLMAQHAGPDACLFTLDLPPEDRRFWLPGTESLSREAQRKRIGERFRDTPYQRQVTQLHGDSATFDFSPYRGRIDLVFVDAVHTYEYVKNDTLKALEMLSSRGTIIWDDCSAAIPDVPRALEVFGEAIPIYRVAETRLAVHTRQSRD